MSAQNSQDNMLGAIAEILIRSFIIGIALLTVWLILVIGLPDWAWQMHAKIFDLSREQVARAHYAGLIVTKAGIFTLFLFPYISIKLVLRKKGHFQMETN